MKTEVHGMQAFVAGNRPQVEHLDGVKFGETEKKPLPDVNQLPLERRNTISFSSASWLVIGSASSIRSSSFEEPASRTIPITVLNLPFPPRCSHPETTAHSTASHPLHERMWTNPNAFCDPDAPIALRSASVTRPGLNARLTIPPGTGTRPSGSRISPSPPRAARLYAMAVRATSSKV